MSTNTIDSPLQRTKASTPPDTGTLSSVNSSGSDGLILDANNLRKGATFYNASTQILYLGLSTTTTTTSVYTVQIAASGYYELPMTQGGPYTGQIRGIWASANGAVKITEFV